MHLIQFLLPLTDNAGTPLPKALFEQVRTELAERFGGVTAYTRSPAKGVWADASGALSRDDVVLVELLAGTVDRAWWRDYRKVLEHRFRQEEVLVRAVEVETL